MRDKRFITTPKRIYIILAIVITTFFSVLCLFGCVGGNQDTNKDAFLTLKSYIMQNGTYDYNDKEYIIVVGSSYSSTFIRKFGYDVADEEIKLMVFVGTDYFFEIELKTADGLYTWGYADNDNNFMLGNLNASNYELNDLLEYTRNNINSAQVRTSVNKRASEMASYLIKNLDTDLAIMGLKVVDFGFNLIQ